MAIARTVAIEQGKGGVGKTSLVANVGGLAAAAGVRTLIVDLDPQGNIARDLGFPPSDGQALFNAFATGGSLPVLKDIRPNLDVVPGGPAVGDIAGLNFSWQQRGAGDFGVQLERTLGAIAGEYDLILLDTPPGDRVIAEGALAVATSVVIPTRSDEASIDGVARVAERFQNVATRNPQLRLAGVVLFAVGSRSVRLERDVRAALTDLLGGVAPVFETRIRHLDSAAVDARSRGLLIHELEQAAKDDRAARLTALKAKEKPADGLFVRDASGLAEDYENLTREILTVLGQIQNEVEVA
ncbi:ParA family protein [Cryobacterium sp. TMT1-21]|uniref:ParA family protein n=2 Tax=Cryobacterium cheniae TaxID=1259262 RepID=A0A4R8XXP0_9MICO|nr:ParA family protein [Cryobacterium sp. TMT1-21]TFC83398.1 ParA family protein [Cryobacterium cheniae]TFD11331.1 ParA family protein [Cryobacterium sp. TMT1-21]